MKLTRLAAATAAAGVLALSGSSAAYANHTGDTRNCSDFSSQIKIVNGYDPAHLDADHDGIGCENLPGPPVVMDLYSDLRDPSATATPSPTLAATGVGDLVSRHPVRTVGVAVVLIGAGGVLAYGVRRKEDR